MHDKADFYRFTGQWMLNGILDVLLGTSQIPIDTMYGLMPNLYFYSKFRTALEFKGYDWVTIVDGR
jgi:hypothetical protein